MTDILSLKENLLKKMNSYIFCSHNIIYSLLKQFELVIEYEKCKVFHFSRLYSFFDLPPLKISHFGGYILKHKEIWKYLSFIFHRKLSFWQHVKFYNKVLSTVKYLKLLGNSTQSLLSYQKHLLYRICILLIELYSFPLWHYNNIPLLYQEA